MITLETPFYFQLLGEKFKRFSRNKHVFWVLTAATLLSNLLQQLTRSNTYYPVPKSVLFL